MGLMTPSKAQGFRLVKKVGPNYLLSTRDSYQTEGHLQSENNVSENHLPFKRSSQESRGSHPLSGKLNFTPKTVVRDEDGHEIILKGSIQQEDLPILNIYAPNVGAAKYLNQIITKVKKYLDNYYLILGDFNLALTTLDRSSKHNISKEGRALNDTLDQMDFTDIYRTLHPN